MTVLHKDLQSCRADFQALAAYRSKNNRRFLILVHPFHRLDPSFAKFRVSHPHPNLKWEKPFRTQDNSISFLEAMLL